MTINNGPFLYTQNIHWLVTKITRKFAFKLDPQIINYLSTVILQNYLPTAPNF